ncbi:MAG: MFS transporter [Puniceicoccaceae bacterium]
MKSQNLNAFIYAAIVAMGGFLFGLDAALIAGTTDYLVEEFGLTSIQLGTVVSAPALGVLIALPFAGYICDRFGRKKAILTVAALYLISAVASAYAPSYEVLVVARFLGGLAFSSISLASMYIGEIAPPKWRGKLVFMTQFNIVVGLSGAYFVNLWIYQWAGSGAGWVQALGIDTYIWRWMLGSEIPVAIIWFLLVLIIPESPSWLFLRERVEDSKRTLRKLLPDEAAVEHHIVEMKESLLRSADEGTIKAQLKELFGNSMRLTFIIALTIAIAQQATGINAILFYAQTVFKQLGIGTDAAFSQAIWVGLISVVFTTLGLLLIDKIGRRPMVIGGMLWVIISLGVSSYNFHQATYTLTPESIANLEEIPDASRLAPMIGVQYDSDIAFKRALDEALGTTEAQKYQSILLENAVTMNATLVLIGILSFIAAFQFSVGPVMWVLFSELFPISVRGIAIPFFTIVTSLTNYVVQKFFPWQLENMGMSTILLFYAVTVAVGMTILFFTLIETKNMSIEEIQEAMAKK